jgi:membrane protease YdiL (CAAX protease family)
MASWPWWLPWLVYGPMGAVGAAWAYWARGAVLTLPEETRSSALQNWGVWVWCLVALGFAAATVASTRLLVKHTKWARRLHMRLRGLLLGLSGSRIALLSLLSATAEELVFRAALAPSLGLVWSSVLFGALHVSPRGAGHAWGLWAFVMGLCFGALYFASGSLLPPILAHAVINFENMHYICSFDPTRRYTRRAGPQGSLEPPV